MSNNIKNQSFTLHGRWSYQIKMRSCGTYIIPPGIIYSLNNQVLRGPLATELCLWTLLLSQWLCRVSWYNYRSTLRLGLAWQSWFSVLSQDWPPRFVQLWHTFRRTTADMRPYLLTPFIVQRSSKDGNWRCSDSAYYGMLFPLRDNSQTLMLS